MSGILCVISLIFTSAVVRDFPFQLSAQCQLASYSTQGIGLGILLLSFQEHMLFKLDYTDVSETRSLCRGTFPAAGENAKEIIRLSIVRCNESSPTQAIDAKPLQNFRTSRAVHNGRGTNSQSHAAGL